MKAEALTLSDFVTLQRGFDLPARNRKFGVVPIVASTGISGYHNEAKVRAPGVVIGRSGSIGGGQYITENFWPLNTTLWVKDFKGNNPQFTYYLLKSIDFTRFNAGAGVPTLNRNHIASIHISNYDIDSQARIASVLSTYDDLIENNRRRIQLLEESARLLYREWFVDLRFPGHEHVKVVDGVPEGWERKVIDDIAETIGGGTPSTKVPEYWENGEIPWFSPSDLTKNNCLILLDSNKKITEAGLKKSSAKMLPPETILMSSRASIGFFGLYEFECCTNQGFISCVPKYKNFRMYLLYNLMARVEEIIGLASGTTFKEISKKTFRSIPVIMPESEILEEFENYVCDLINQIRVLQKQNQKLIQARDLLLPRLMSGEIEL